MRSSPDGAVGTFGDGVRRDSQLLTLSDDRIMSPLLRIECVRVFRKEAMASGFPHATCRVLRPTVGRARRARFLDQGRARMRRFRERAARRARYREGKFEGMQARARGAGVFHPVDDHGIADHLKQVLARHDHVERGHWLTGSCS
jgi:hypothetical protein